MTPVLHASRNPNPRLAVAVARYLDAPVEIRFARVFHPDLRPRFLELNPSGLLPILEWEGGSLWEADAIACHLSQLCGSEFWRSGAALPDMIRWISWGKANFVMACDIVHFERGTKRRYNLGPTDPAKIAEGLEMFAGAARLLNDALSGRDWLGGTTPSYADFRMASYLVFNDVAGLPVDDHPAVAAWLKRLDGLPHWADPFAGLDFPPLPAPIPEGDSR